MIVSWNESLVEADEVKVSASNAMLLRGEGVFETIRVISGEALYFEDHCRRLTSSAQRLGLMVPREQTLDQRIKELVRENGLTDARVRVTLGEDCLVTAEALEPEILSVAVSILGKAHPVNERSPLAGVKCISYAENMVLLRLADTDEVLRANTRGDLCEGCLSNVFFVKNGKVHTPALETGCLAGVMRQQVMKLTDVEEGVWPFEIVNEADEIWMSNSIRRLRFVSSIDGKSKGEASELFHSLRSQLR